MSDSVTLTILGWGEVGDVRLGTSLYSHSGGAKVMANVLRALAGYGWDRVDDEEYFTRIAASEMFDDLKGSPLGGGISPALVEPGKEIEACKDAPHDFGNPSVVIDLRHKIAYRTIVAPEYSSSVVTFDLTQERLGEVADIICPSEH